VNQLPESLRKLCKWKMCSITPNIVRATVARSNFRLSSGKNDFLGVWGSHMKPEMFKSFREFQKINHFPGSFQIGRKDRLCRNLYHAQAKYGKNEYNFVPLTFVIPNDYCLFKAEVETGPNKNAKWIIKPVRN
jgi:tubulin polyglutamylase TTLL4